MRGRERGRKRKGKSKQVGRRARRGGGGERRGRAGKGQREEGTSLTRLRSETWEPSKLLKKQSTKLNQLKEGGEWQRKNGAPWGAGA